MTDFWEYENKRKNDKIQLFCGVDEAGRGPLAGPVFAAAVILPHGFVLDGLNDSKKVTPKKRDALFEQIIEKAQAFGISFATVEEIEDINILNASLLAMRRSVEKLNLTPDLVVVDGNRCPELGDIPCESLVKGDSKSANIAAASILAKVARDRFMLEMDQKYPQYRFAKHKGYGTALHCELLREYGPCPIHRPSFLNKILGQGDR